MTRHRLRHTSWLLAMGLILQAVVHLPVQFAQGNSVPFTIFFSESRVSLAGPIDSKATADRLANAILSARPDLEIINAGLDFDGKSHLSEETLFHSLVIEVALSTHEGEIEWSDRHLLVGGLTDSVLTASVLKLRAALFIGERVYKERLCEVPTEDLPEIPLLLSSGESRKAFSFDLRPAEKNQGLFLAPGVLLEKILGLIEGTADFSALLGDDPASSSASPVIVTETAPVNPDEMVALEVVAEAPKMIIPVEEPSVGPVVEAVDPYEDLGPVLFGRNSFLLQSGQEQNLSNVMAQLGTAQWIGKPILIQVTTYKAGSTGFSSWLGERRGGELVKLMTAAGISRDLIIVQLLESTTDSVDEGKVGILLPRRAQP